MKAKLKDLVDLVLTLLLVALGFFCLFSLCFKISYSAYGVVGYSMYPTLNKNAENSDEIGDIVYVNNFKDFDVGDIVVIKTNWPVRGDIIKRIVAGPNDILTIKEENDNYVLYVNNVEVEKQKITYVSQHGLTGGTYEYFKSFNSLLANPQMADNVVIDKSGDLALKCGKNQYFLMGDNWGETTDSVTHGFVLKNQVIGKVELVVKQNESRFNAVIKHIAKIIFKY